MVHLQTLILLLLLLLLLVTPPQLALRLRSTSCLWLDSHPTYGRRPCATFSAGQYQTCTVGCTSHCQTRPIRLDMGELSARHIAKDSHTVFRLCSRAPCVASEGFDTACLHPPASAAAAFGEGPLWACCEVDHCRASQSVAPAKQGVLHPSNSHCMPHVSAATCVTPQPRSCSFQTCPALPASSSQHVSRPWAGGPSGSVVRF